MPASLPSLELLDSFIGLSLLQIPHERACTGCYDG